KIFGYVGTMAAWFDWDWVTALANSRADDEIRLIGPLFKSPTKRLPNNIRLLPPCKHAAALKAMLEFDVGLIPFKKNELTTSVDPIKYYEYRALALPVLSTDFGEMRLRSEAPGVFISQSEQDVEYLVQKALNCERDVEQAHAFALSNSWQVRFDAAQLLS
ncbi:MAG: glycosyltransferase family 1 protein, partial [Desulfobulbus sp.]|nr:glycosyltransferase family 1 protein [Desulfobulbus sp.]